MADPDVRFSLANERTLLAYQRTAIGLIAAAVAVVHFLDNDVLAVALSGVLLASAGVAAIGGMVRYRAADRAIRTGQPLSEGQAPVLLSLGLTVCLALAVVYVVVTAT